MRVVALGDGLVGHVLIFGEAEQHPNPLVRIHSRCLYGDALHSDDCDCGPELDLAMDLIQAEGAGVLAYLEQEGRGAGLVVKAMGLRLTEQHGLDTFASYSRLNQDADSRRYDQAADALAALGLRSVRLMTNNPAKVEELSKRFTVTSVPLLTRPRSERAVRYLEAKREVSRHELWPTQTWRIAQYGWRVAAVIVAAAAAAAVYLAEREFIILSQLFTMAYLLVHPAGGVLRLRIRRGLTRAIQATRKTTGS